MRVLLWPVAIAEHAAEIETILSTGLSGALPVTILVAEDESGTVTGSWKSDCGLVRTVAIRQGWSALWKAGLPREAFRTGDSAGNNAL
jgi:hypothetical protein